MHFVLFEYQSDSLEDVLVQAKAYAAEQEAGVTFFFNTVCFFITQRSILAEAWIAYWEALRTGSGMVWLCEEPSGKGFVVPQGWSNEQIANASRVIRALNAA